MSKFSKLLKGIYEIVKHPYLINRIVDSDEVWSARINNTHAFSGFPVVSFDQLFDKIADHVDPYTFNGGGSLITDLILLKSAAHSFPDCSFFEIGTWRGESVANVAEVAKECFTLNLSDEELKAMNLSDSYIRQIGMFSKDSDRITHLSGNSTTFDFAALNKKFDLIFIDGNHHYDYVFNDTKKVFHDLVHKNSVVIWHDYAYHPESLRPEVACAILDACPKECHPFIWHPEGSICAIYFPKKLQGRPFQSYIPPKNSFRITLEKKVTQTL